MLHSHKAQNYNRSCTVTVYTSTTIALTNTSPLPNTALTSTSHTPPTHSPLYLATPHIRLQRNRQHSGLPSSLACIILITHHTHTPRATNAPPNYPPPFRRHNNALITQYNSLHAYGHNPYPKCYPTMIRTLHTAMVLSPTSRPITTHVQRSASSTTCTYAYYRQHYTLPSGAYLTSIAQQQLTKHQIYYRTPTKPLIILNLYYDKITHNRTLNNALKTLNITDKSSLAHIYHQAWNIITISLLQRARNVQHIIHALVYHQQTKSTLNLPLTPARTRIPLPTRSTFAATVLETHRFTTTTTRTTNANQSPSLVEPCSPRRCTYPR